MGIDHGESEFQIVCLILGEKKCAMQQTACSAFESTEYIGEMSLILSTIIFTFCVLCFIILLIVNENIFILLDFL